MEITQIRIAPHEDERLKAFVSITFDDCFAIKGLKIIKGPRGLFVAMPSRKRPDGRYEDICHPIDSKTRDWIESEILQEYERLTGDELQGQSSGVPLGWILPPRSLGFGNTRERPA